MNVCVSECVMRRDQNWQDRFMCKLTLFQLFGQMRTAEAVVVVEFEVIWPSRLARPVAMVVQLAKADKLDLPYRPII